jgi:hypothetical protein
MWEMEMEMGNGRVYLYTSQCASAQCKKPIYLLFGTWDNNSVVSAKSIAPNPIENIAGIICPPQMQ